MSIINLNGYLPVIFSFEGVAYAGKTQTSPAVTLNEADIIVIAESLNLDNCSVKDKDIPEIAEAIAQRLLSKDKDFAALNQPSKDKALVQLIETIKENHQGVTLQGLLTRWQKASYRRHCWPLFVGRLPNKVKLKIQISQIKASIEEARKIIPPVIVASPVPPLQSTKPEPPQLINVVKPGTKSKPIRPPIPPIKPPVNQQGLDAQDGVNY